MIIYRNDLFLLKVFQRHISAVEFEKCSLLCTVSLVSRSARRPFPSDIIPCYTFSAFENSFAVVTFPSWFLFSAKDNNLASDKHREKALLLLGASSSRATKFKHSRVTQLVYCNRVYHL